MHSGGRGRRRGTRGRGPRSGVPPSLPAPHAAARARGAPHQPAGPAPPARGPRCGHPPRRAGPRPGAAAWRRRPRAGAAAGPHAAQAAAGQRAVRVVATCAGASAAAGSTAAAGAGWQRAVVLAACGSAAAGRWAAAIASCRRGEAALATGPYRRCPAAAAWAVAPAEQAAGLRAATPPTAPLADRQPQRHVQRVGAASAAPTPLPAPPLAWTASR